MLVAILIATIVGAAFALWSTTVPVHSNLKIVGPPGLTAYNEAGCTTVFSGVYNYTDTPTFSGVIAAPQAIWLKNTGSVPLKVSWNATGTPQYITVLGAINDVQTAWASNTLMTLNANSTLQVRFNLQSDTPNLGSYSWDTVIYAVQA